MDERGDARRDLGGRALLYEVQPRQPVDLGRAEQLASPLTLLLGWHPRIAIAPENLRGVWVLAQVSGDPLLEVPVSSKPRITCSQARPPSSRLSSPW